MNKARVLLVAGLITIFVLPIVVGLAITLWSKNFYWGFPTESFQVYSDSDYLQVWSPGDENLTSLVQAAYFEGVSEVSKTFYIKNDGPVPTTVTVNVLSSENCTALWTPETLALGIGDSGSMMLNLTITSEGNYEFTFS